MGKWRFTLPDGSVYDAEAGTWEEAQKGLGEQVDQERIAASKKEYEDAPITSKARMIIGDPIQQFGHGLTAGLIDVPFGEKAKADTQAAADRIGPAGTTAARLGGAMMLPSAAPRAVAAVGGGPLVRTAVGATTAAGEGGIYGGINAATSPTNPITGEPSVSVPTGVLGGAVGGAVGNPIGQAIGNTANATIKWLKGVKDAAPPRNITQIPQGVANPSSRDLVDIAAAKASSTGSKKGSAEATQAAQRDAFEKLATGKFKGQFTPTQLERMREIYQGDVGTRGAEATGKFLSNKLLSGGILGSSFGTGNAVPGLLAAGTALGGGKALTVDAAKATQEAVDSLRQLIYKKTPFRGPMTPARKRTLGQGIGYLGMEGVEDYLN
jgi:hypothetical protein